VSEPTAEPVPAATPAPVSPTDVVHEVTLATTPSGANVRLSGAVLGTTPYVLKYRAATTVQVEMSGYLEEDVHVDAKSDPNIVIVLHPDPAAEEITPASTIAPTPTPAPRSAAAAKPAAPTPAPTAPTEPATPRPSSGGLPYPDVAAAKADYQAGRIDRDAYDQAVRKLKNRRSEKIAVIKAKYQAGEIDKDEYARRKRIIDNEYRGA